MYRVTLADQTIYDANVVGFDQDKDVAVLRVNAPKEKLKPIPLGVSADLLVGQKVFAIGNPVSMTFFFLILLHEQFIFLGSTARRILLFFFNPYVQQLS